MSGSLIEALQQVEDPRQARGRRYPLWVVLLLVILAMMSQCQGYCSPKTFARQHKDALIAALGLPCKRLPSDSTFRLILQQSKDPAASGRGMVADLLPNLKIRIAVRPLRRRAAGNLPVLD